MKKCYQCQKEILDNTKKCPYCGAEQKEETVLQDKQTCFCSGCGASLREGDAYCSKCGKPVSEENPQPIPEPIPEPISEPISEPVSETNSTSTEGNADNKATPTAVRLPDGFLKMYGIVFGIMYAYFALTYLPYLSYYAMQDKLWGVGMILACVWSSFILFIIAFKCQKAYGTHLLYALFGGAILKDILHLINIQRLARYEYWSNSSSSYLPVIGALLVAFGCYFAMKKEEMLEQGKESFSEIIKEIPQTLQMILQNNSHEIKPPKPGKVKNPLLI